VNRGRAEGHKVRGEGGKNYNRRSKRGKLTRSSPALKALSSLPVIWGGTRLGKRSSMGEEKALELRREEGGVSILGKRVSSSMGKDL